MEDEIWLDVVNEINEGSTEKHSWTVEIKEELSDIESIRKKKKRAKKNKNTIYKLPAIIRINFDPYDYEPYKVSFGPYHHDHDSCKQTQQIKKHVVLYSLRRTNKTIDDYVKVLSEVVQDLKDAYDELDPKWQQDDDDFLKLMIYDGCFLLEIVNEAHDYGNPVCDIDGISPRELMEYYRHDVLLLENQIPMLVLEKLVAVQTDKSIQEAQKYLYELMLRFVAPSSANIAEELLRQEPERMYLHLLDLYRHSLLYEEYSPRITEFDQRLLDLLKPRSFCKILRNLLVLLTFLIVSYVIVLPIMIIVLIVLIILLMFIVIPVRIQKSDFRIKPPSDFPFFILSATELDNVGIGFEMNRTKSLKDISYIYAFGFRLLLPQIYVDGATQSRFLNIIAFEQLHADAENVVTSYIYFMSRLLQATGDVRLLQLNYIILTSLQNDEVVKLFKILTKGIVHDPNILLFKTYPRQVEILTEVFYNSAKRRWGREFYQTYLRSPWRTISVVAAFFLFTLTGIQTVYTVLGYLHS